MGWKEVEKVRDEREVEKITANYENSESTFSVTFSTASHVALFENLH